jgi:hypothetical protein
MKRRIVTEFVYPPRTFDWCATLDDYEPGDLVGYGPTERDAIIDLESQLDGLRWYEELDHGSRP